VLSELRVRDVAVIADVSLPLGAGLNVLTGETGAGKSMLVDTLALLLGERASVDLVRPAAQRAVVEAAFDCGDSPAAAAAAGEAGIDLDQGQLVVRREINKAGRNRAWANGSPASVGALASVGRVLVDLHGQHEAQSLLDADTQREMLDAYAGAAGERARVGETFGAARTLRAEEASLSQRRDEVRRRADYLRHVVREIREAAPKIGEDEALDAEARRLANAEEVTELAERIAGLVDGGNGDALSALAGAARALAQLERLDPTVASWREFLEAAEANLAELALAAREYGSQIEADPDHLSAIERRRDQLYRLRHKYGETLAAVIQTADEAAAELDLLDTADQDLEQLAKRRAAAETALAEAASALRARRAKAAGRLAKAVTALLPGLGMRHGRLSVELDPLDEVRETGGDRVRFVVQINPGMDARPLAQVASGGELSRTMLALKVVLADQDAVPTLVFDEVDQGIGGEVAVQVATALRRVARRRQVLVITHLPQIAAQADHHVCITKRARGGIATSDVRVLLGEERAAEIARMLGDADGAVALQHANEMLKRTTAAGV
jgi:DNA repair protein RecN (Recombination protein N)